MSRFDDELKKLGQLPQRQDALNNQLIDLALAANRFGMYDAAHFIELVLSNESGRWANKERAGVRGGKTDAHE